MVSTYKELIEKWGGISRNEMSFEDELEYIEDWYELGKNLPTKPLEPNFTEYAKYKGQQFKIVGTVSYVNDNADLETLPLWKVEMPDKTLIWTDCNEIFDWDSIISE